MRDSPSHESDRVVPAKEVSWAHPMADRNFPGVSPGRALLPWVLSNPERAGRLDRNGWQQLIRQARNADLLGQLQFALAEAGAVITAPVAAQRQLQIAQSIAEKHAQAIQMELHNVHEALQPVGVPVILLKGAAYRASKQRAAQGRQRDDIDILVPKGALTLVEATLTQAGWIGARMKPYDQRYYRQWMHEIPPMGHRSRSSVLEVHHALVAPSSGIRPCSQMLFDATQPMEGKWPLFRVLSQEDMVMHSATHLFFGEFQRGLRDLYDVHALLSDFSRDEAFWGRLLERSAQMGLLLPVTDAIRHARRLFETAVPAPVQRTFGRRASAAWPGFIRDWLFDQVLRPPHVSADGAATRLANWLVFVRSHWLRMPLPLMAYHLTHQWIHADGKQHHGQTQLPDGK